MPSLSQIIPNYTVPHVQTYINDNSTVTDVVATPIENGVRLLCVFASPKGEDGVVKTIHSVTEFLNEYGVPNYALYGQPAYNAYAALASGNAICHCMRIAANDATYASLVVSAKAKFTEEEDETSVDVKFTAEALTSASAAITSKDVLATAVDALYTGDPDDDGYVTYPLFGMVAKGRGIYGNALSVKLSEDTVSNGENDYMNYLIDIIDSSTGTPILKEEFRGCFYEDAVSDNASLLFDDVLADPDNGSKTIEFYTCQTGWANFIKDYNTEMVASTASDDEKIKMTDVNIFTGKRKDGGEINTKYTINEGTVVVSDTLGINLAGGSDGSFGADTADATRATAMDAQYIEAFSNKVSGGSTESTRYDKAILSKRRTPAELILDAGYSANVKAKLIELGKRRYDARVVLDAGIITNYSAAITAYEGLSNTDNFIYSKEFQHFKIRDPFTGKVIPVTATYFIASNLPTHYEVEGNHIPFVGSQYATLTGYVKNSLMPVIDADDLDIKEKLYTNKINFFECIAEDTFVRGTQVTAQTKTSDLSEENNVAVLLEMKRRLENYVSGKLYNFADAEDRVIFTRDAEDLFTEYRGSKVRDFNVYFDMNAFEEARNILHCYLSVTFRTLAKRGIIEIDINKRS